MFNGKIDYWSSSGLILPVFKGTEGYDLCAGKVGNPSFPAITKKLVGLCSKHSFIGDIEIINKNFFVVRAPYPIKGCGYVFATMVVNNVKHVEQLIANQSLTYPKLAEGISLTMPDGSELTLFMVSENTLQVTIE